MLWDRPILSLAYTNPGLKVKFKNMVIQFSTRSPRLLKVRPGFEAKENFVDIEDRTTKRAT